MTRDRASDGAMDHSRDLKLRMTQSMTDDLPARGGEPESLPLMSESESLAGWRPGRSAWQAEPACQESVITQRSFKCQ